MSKCRQNLAKRTVHVARRSRYDFMASSYGPEWERLCERRGLAPPRRKTPDGVVRTLSSNSVYGKFAKVQASSAYGGTVEGVVFQSGSRAQKKQASRDADASAVSSGAKSVADLRAENGSFAFPNARVSLRPQCKPPSDGVLRLGLSATYGKTTASEQWEKQERVELAMVKLDRKRDRE